jgi:hypothetical protein
MGPHIVKMACLPAGNHSRSSWNSIANLSFLLIHTAVCVQLISIEGRQVQIIITIQAGLPHITSSHEPWKHRNYGVAPECTVQCPLSALYSIDFPNRNRDPLICGQQYGSCMALRREYQHSTYFSRVCFAALISWFALSRSAGSKL